MELSDPAFEQEGLRYATVKSRALHRRADISFWAPPGAERVGTLLILLHGVYGSHWAWAGKGGAHRTAAALLARGRIEPMALAMPSDGLGRDGSGYLHWPPAEGSAEEDVERFVLEEAPALAELAVPALLPGYQTAIAGLSMGGWGALRLGAKYPERFCAVSAHSAITKIEDLAAFTEEPMEQYLSCAPREELHALFWLKKNAEILPPLRFDCGDADPLLASNRALHAALDRHGIPHEYREFAGGHEWPYWRQHLEETLLHVDRHSRGARTR